MKMLLSYRQLMTAGCSVNQHNMYGNTPIEMATNAGHQEIVMELMQSQFTLLPDVFFKEIGKCKNYHTNIFPSVIGTGHSKLDFGMNQYFTSGWQSNYHRRKIKYDIE